MTSDNDLEKCKQALAKLAPSERRAVETYCVRKSPAPRLTVENSDGKLKISNDHPDADIGMIMLAQQLGTADLDFAAGVIEEIANLPWSGRGMSVSELNYLRSTIAEMRPQTPAQTLLTVELFVNHKLLLENARRASCASSLEERESAMQAHHKLSRNSAGLAEALDRLQSGGGQPVVNNVSIREGSQAILGNLTQVRNEQVPVAPPVAPDAEPTAAPDRPRRKVLRRARS
jgi:hypothetical protein